MSQPTIKQQLYAIEFKTPFIHCQNKGCNRQEFLPINCSACRKNFCQDCYKYEAHNCPKAQDSFQIPKCSACQSAVPFLDSSRNAEKTIDFHLRFHCSKTEGMRKKIVSPKTSLPGSKAQGPSGSSSKSPGCTTTCSLDSAADSSFKILPETVKPLPKPKIYKNKCNKGGCKKKSAHSFKCHACRKSFCVSHRLESDHECVGAVVAGRELRLRKFAHLSIAPIVACC